MSPTKKSEAARGGPLGPVRPGYHRSVVTAAPRALGLRARYLQTARPSPGDALPRFGGNAHLGCGLVVRELKGRRYLYFWAYEDRSWGAHRRGVYVGPVARPGTRASALRLLLEYHNQVRREVDRRIAALESTAARAR